MNAGKRFYQARITAHQSSLWHSSRLFINFYNVMFYLQWHNIHLMHVVTSCTVKLWHQNCAKIKRSHNVFNVAYKNKTLYTLIHFLNHSFKSLDIPILWAKVYF